MAGRSRTGSDATSGLESIGAMVHQAVGAQERALEVTQGWSESVLGTLKEQAESYGAMLRSVDASLRAMEQAIKSQTETTKALAESLEASRQVVGTAMEAQQHSIEQVESFVGGMLGVLTGQLQAVRTQVEIGRGMLSDPLSAQSEIFLKMSQDWMDAYGRLLGAASTSPRRTGGG